MRLPKLVKIKWENGDKQYASPIAETNDTYIFDVQTDNCYWVYKEICEIIIW